MSNTIVIYHRADYDGIFCREIAKKFLPDAELFGWDYGDPEPAVPLDAKIYMLDISVDGLMNHPGLIWIDHHKSAMEKYDPTGWIYEPAGKDSFGVNYNAFWRRGHETRTTQPPTHNIPGYRIDGVAACRLAWQWFAHSERGLRGNSERHTVLPLKEAFLARNVDEPMAVRLAGEYDIWDHRGDGDIEFQFGLDACRKIPWDVILDVEHPDCRALTGRILNDGDSAMRCYAKRDADVMQSRSFTVEFDGLRFLVLNTARCNSNTFAGRDVPETGHDALMAFYYNGNGWNFSLYHANHRKDLDLSTIAVKYGGGGHRGACGFRMNSLKDFPILA